MDNLSNASVNCTSPHPLSGPGYVVFNVVMLLGVVLPVIVANTVILVALVLEPFIVNIIRLVLGSILVSCLIGALGLAMNHIAGIVLNLSPVNNPPDLPCTITVFLIGFGGAARLVFMATFAVIVYIIVKHGETPKKRFVIASFLAVVVLWVISFLGASPLFSQAVIYSGYLDSLSCSFRPVGIFSYVFAGLYALLFGLITISITIILLVITLCYIKRLTVQDIKLEKATVKFGFFLLLGNGINLFGQVATPLIAVITFGLTYASSDKQTPFSAERAYTVFTLLNAALIPTPILVLIYFKPIRNRLWQWLCCCMPTKIKAKCFHKSSNMEVRRTQKVTAI